MLIGAVADDITGATDLCLMLSREGMKTLQVIGVPEEGADFGDADAVVVALKSRTIPAEEAVGHRGRRPASCLPPAQSSCCLNIARRSIPPMTAISGRSPTRFRI